MDCSNRTYSIVLSRTNPSLTTAASQPAHGPSSPETAEQGTSLLISALLELRPSPPLFTSSLTPQLCSGTAKVCGRNNNPLAVQQGQQEGSSCADRPGNAYLCSDYQPRPISDDLSYAFAITNGRENCCQCYELQWTDGAGRGKRVQVQIINTAGKADPREFILLTPGGGVGPNTNGCTSQYGSEWYVLELPCASHMA